MSNPGTIDTSTAATTSYQGTQAQTTPGFFDTALADIQDPTSHPIVFIVGGLALAAVLFLGSKPKKKKTPKGQSAHADIKIF